MAQPISIDIAKSLTPAYSYPIVTSCSREFATLTYKRHFDVMRDIERMA